MELRDYLRVLRTHWLGVLLIVGAVLAGTLVFTWLQPRVYAANASGFVGTGATDDPALGSINDQLAKSRATSYVDIARSRATAIEVAADLGLDTDPATLVSMIDVEQPPDTVLIKVTARADTPSAARRLADAWVTALAAQVASIEDPGATRMDGVLRVVPIESAELPSSPLSPNPRRNLALGLLAGLLLALAYALLRNALDRRLRDPDKIEADYGTSVVAFVPTSDALDRTRGHPLVVDDRPARGPEGQASEAFKKLRTNLMFMDVDDPPRSIVVTSPRPGDGKSTIAANLAAAIAVSGQPVVLVDADLRRSSLADSLGLVEGVGLTDVLVGRIGLDAALQAVADHANLQVLAAGRIPPNPSELLGSRAMRQLTRQLAESALVVFDAPPLLPVTDAAVLTANADGALVVLTAGSTLDTELDSALSHLAAVKGRVLGVIFNRTPRKGGGYYGYYGDYYGPRSGSRHKARSSRASRAAGPGEAA